MADNIFKTVGRALGLVEDVPVDIDKRSSVPTDTLGNAGDLTSGGFVISVDRDVSLMGDRRWRTYRDLMVNTAIIGAGVRLTLRMIRKAEWTANPADGQEENPQAQEYADALYDMMFDMTSPWSKVVGKVALKEFNGFSVLEWTAKRRPDGKIGMLDIENRPPETIVRWNVDPSGTVLSCFQKASMGGGEIELPRERIVYGVEDALTDSPEGIGLFRHLAPLAHRLKAYAALEEVGFENDLRGVPIGYAPLGEIAEEAKKRGPAGPAYSAAVKKPLTDLVRSHIRNKATGALLSSETYRDKGETQSPGTAKKWGLDLLSGDATGFDGIANAIKRITTDAALLMGVEHVLLGADGAGSLALGKTKTDGFYLMVTGILQDLVEIFESDFVAPIGNLNGWPIELWPTLAVEEITESDIAEITEALAKMAQAGAVLGPDDPVINEVRDLMGLSRPPEPDEADLTLAADRKRKTLRLDPADPEDPMAPVEKRKRKWVTSRKAQARMRRVMAEAR